jgi:hypothetical protein
VCGAAAATDWPWAQRSRCARAAGAAAAISLPPPAGCCRAVPPAWPQDAPAASRADAPAPPTHPPRPAGQEGAIGLNLLCDEGCNGIDGYNTTKFRNRRAETLTTISRAPDVTLAGPYWLTQGGFGAIARRP